jgi:hypothetical protein
MMPRNSARTVLFGVVAAVLASVSPLHAVEACKVKVGKTGTISVSARNVTGGVLWGPVSGAETTPFENAATCLVRGRARRCRLGAARTAGAITPPPLCMIYLADGGPTTCAAHIKGCTPGVRASPDLSDIPTLQAAVAALQSANANLQAQVAGLQTLLASVSLHDGGATVRFTGVDVQIVSGSGSTAGPLNGRGNLIVGYNEVGGTCADGENGGYPCAVDGDCPLSSCALGGGKQGSHNLVVGAFHLYTSYGSIVGGFNDAVTAPHTFVVGAHNNAYGVSGSVTGGVLNVAAAPNSSVSGGTGRFTTVDQGWAAGAYGTITSGIFTSPSPIM